MDSNCVRYEHALIKIVGIGSAGVRALENIIHSDVNGVEYISTDADKKTFFISYDSTKININLDSTDTVISYKEQKVYRGVSRKVMLALRKVLNNADMVFLLANIDGGIITESIANISDIARKSGVEFIVCIVILPFSCEDIKRVVAVGEGLEAINTCVDSLIVVSNEYMLNNSILSRNIHEQIEQIYKNVTFAVRGITEIVTSQRSDPLWGPDYADVITVMASKYPIAFGYGEGVGTSRALKALINALQTLSWGDIEIEEASGILVYIVGSDDMTFDDINAVNNFIHKKNSYLDTVSKIGFGRDDSMGNRIRVTIYLTKTDENLSRPLEEFGGHT